MNEPTASGAVAAEGRGYSVSSLVMAALAVAFIPPLHGLVGVALGYVGHRKGDPLGRTAMVCSVVGMLVGSVVAVAIYRA